MDFETLLKDFSGQLSRMKERDGNDKLNQICLDKFKEDLSRQFKKNIKNF